MYKIAVDHTPSQSDIDVIKESLIAFNESIVGVRAKQFSVFLKNDSGKVFGGILAFLDKESVYIDLLWIEEHLRKQGYGKKLLDTAEQEAIKKGCLFSTLDTYDFQAEAFYLKNGYERMGEIKNYWLDHTKIFLRKNLKVSI